MLKIIKFIFKIFSIYEVRLEKDIDSFLNKLTKNSDKLKTKQMVLDFMKKNLIIFNIWLERKYKGYKYLNKKNRRLAYINANRIKERFKTYCDMLRVDFEFMRNEFMKQKVDIRLLKGYEKEFRYLYKITEFFKKYVNYQYQEASTLGRLLKDPATEILKGDCNQIVTMYIYLFSLKYDISKLQLKVFEEHVCLHLNGVDIEATKGAFTIYDKKDMKISPIEEIISINLLDVSDSRKKIIKISPKYILESSKLAFLLSSDTNIVRHNLRVAYKNLSIEYSKKNNFKLAIKYAKLSEDTEFIKNIIVNSCYAELKNNNFKVAYKFANMINDSDLNKTIKRAEGIYKYKHGNFSGALNKFQDIDDSKMIKACYESLYIRERKKIKNLKTIAEFRNKKNTLNTMLKFAHKSGNPNLIKHIKSILKQIS